MVDVEQRLTVVELAAMPHDGARYELRRGEPTVVAPAGGLPGGAIEVGEPCAVW